MYCFFSISVCSVVYLFFYCFFFHWYTKFSYQFFNETCIKISNKVLKENKMRKKCGWKQLYSYQLNYDTEEWCFVSLKIHFYVFCIFFLTFLSFAFLFFFVQFDLHVFHEILFLFVYFVCVYSFVSTTIINHSWMHRCICCCVF